MSTCLDLVEKFPNLLSHRAGDLQTVLEGPCSQTHPRAGALAYCSDPEIIESLLKSPVAAIVTSLKLADRFANAANGKVLFASPNVYLAMAFVNRTFFPVPHLRKPFDGQRIHPTAVIHPLAKVAETAVLGPHVVIHEGSSVGERSFLGAHTVIEADVRIGVDCFIHPLVYVGHSTRIGDRVEIKPHSTVGSDGFGYAHDEKGGHHRLPHYGELIIEDDVHIGANVNIDRGTYEPAVIGRNTKIDNHGHLGHNVRVGENCLITAGIITAGSAVIGNNCVFAGRASVNGHIEITDNVTVGPLSAVTNNIKTPGMYAGFPVIPFKEFLKVQASLASLPRLRKNVAKVLRQLGLQDE